MQNYNRKHLSIRDCQSIIMATHDEYMHIWSRVAHDSPWRDTSMIKQPRRIVWEQQCIGDHADIGEIAGHPLVLQMLFAWLDGEPVAFVYFCSRISDREAAAKWLCENAAPDARISDAMNWHNALRD